MASDRGSTLVMATFVLCLLGAVGIALLFLGDIDGEMSQANLRDKQVFYIAEAGLEDAREQLRTTHMASATPAIFSTELNAAAGANATIDASAAAFKAMYDASGQVTGFTGYGDDTPLRGLTSFGNGWYASLLTNDAVEGESNPTDGNARVMITAIGAGAERSLEIVQGIVEKEGIPPPPALITLIGPAPTSPATIYAGGSSGAQIKIGDDCVGASGYSGVPGYSVPIVGTFNATATAQATGNLGGGTNATAAGAPVQDVSGTASALWQDCSYLHDLADKIKDAADAVCTGGSPCSAAYWSATTVQSITFVVGDLDLALAKGLVWVTGAVTLHGGTDFEGTLLVLGEGTVFRDGMGSGHSYGAVVVADIAGPDGVYGNADDCTGGTGGFQPPSYVTSGGGNHDYIFCSQVINLSTNALPLKVTQFRQF